MIVAAQDSRKDLSSYILFYTLTRDGQKRVDQKVLDHGNTVSHNVILSGSKAAVGFVYPSIEWSGGVQFHERNDSGGWNETDAVLDNNLYVIDYTD